MFSREDAVELRSSLAPIEFAGPSNLNSQALAYADYYGLNFHQNSPLQAHRIGTIQSDSFQLVVQYFSVPIEQQRGTAFLVHGYFDHAGLYGNLIKHCLQQGFAVALFDLPGHGLSSGKFASIASFNQYSQAFLSLVAEAEKQQLNKPWYVIGQSTGAAVLVNCVIENSFPRESFAQTILLAPLLYPRNWKATRVLFSVTRWFLSSTNRNFSTNSHDQEFLDFLRTSDSLQSMKLPTDWVLAMIDYHKRFLEFQPQSQAINIIQGTEDQTVNWAYNIKKIEEKFVGTKTYLVNGGRHHLVNESKDYRERVFSLIDQLLK
jgi:alpha-beta hydrolase superfamily lysophospholipase